MRVGLVLGAGGVLGGAWLTGGLSALARDERDPGIRPAPTRSSAPRRARWSGRSWRPGCRPGSWSPTRRGELRRAERPGRRARPGGRPRGGARLRLERGMPRARARLAAAWRSPRSRTRSATRRSSSWPAGCPRGWSRPSRSRTPSGAPSRPLGRAPELLDGGVRLRAAASASPSAAPTRPRPRSPTPWRPRARSRLLPPRADRRPALRRRRRLLVVERRPAGRLRARPRRLPQPRSPTGDRVAALPRRFDASSAT